MLESLSSKSNEPAENAGAEQKFLFELLSDSKSCNQPPPAPEPEPEFSGKPAYDGFQVLYQRLWGEVKKNYYDQKALKDWDRIEHLYDSNISTLGDLDIALKKMAGSLNDRYTWYAGPQEIRQEMELGKKLKSSGLEVHKESGAYRIDGIQYASPAFKTQLQEGDRLKCINGIDIKDLSQKQVRDLLRGPSGKEIEVLASSEETGKEYEVDLKLKDTPQAKIESEILDNDLIYMRFPSFEEAGRVKDYANLAELVRQFEERQKELAGKAAGFVIDLRNNFGGDTEEAILFSSLFLEKGMTVSKLLPRSGIQERVVADESEMVFNRKPIDTDTLATLRKIPLVVLSNGSSASSAELSMGALQDNKRALIIGEQSFGKGVGFKVLFTPQGGNLSLTSLKYLTPDGHDLNGKGIKPDIEVGSDSGAADKQLEAAIKALRENVKETANGKH